MLGKDHVYSLCNDFEGENGALIILDETGNIFTNQTGGVCCNHPQARGRLVLLTVPTEIQTYCLNPYFDGNPGGYLDALLCKYMDHIKLRSDRQEEAWLRITYYNRDAILTWNNSD